MFCSKCGKKNAENAVNCEGCGSQLIANVHANSAAELPNSQMSVLAMVLAFVFPFAGLFVAKAAQKEIAVSNGAKGGAQLAKLAFTLSLVFAIVEVIAMGFWINVYVQTMNEINNVNSQLDDIWSDVPSVCWDDESASYVDC